MVLETKNNIHKTQANTLDDIIKKLNVWSILNEWVKYNDKLNTNTNGMVYKMCYRQ